MALVALILIPWSVWRLVRHRDRIRWWWMIPVPLLGAFLAYQFHHATYMDGDWRVDGFPLPIAIFERVPGGWRDYLGWMTPIAYCGNPVIGLLIPLIPEAFATLIPKKRKPAA